MFLNPRTIYNYKFLFLPLVGVSGRSNLPFFPMSVKIFNKNKYMGYFMVNFEHYIFAVTKLYSGERN